MMKIKYTNGKLAHVSGLEKYDDAINAMIKAGNSLCDLYMPKIRIADLGFSMKSFSGSKFFNSIFDNCQLTHCNFTRTDFNSCHFNDCNFEGSNFLYSSFKNAKFSNCKLSSASFDGVDIGQTAFIDCGTKFATDISGTIDLFVADRAYFISDADILNRFVPDEYKGQKKAEIESLIENTVRLAS